MSRSDRRISSFLFVSQLFDGEREVSVGERLVLQREVPPLGRQRFETVAEHFGHAKWMKLYNEEGTVVFTDVVESPANGHEGVCKFLKEHGVEVVLCNGLGEEARDALFEHSIAVLAGLYGKADDLVIAMLENRLRYGTPDATCHHEGGCSCGCSCGEDGCSDDCGCGCGC